MNRVSSGIKTLDSLIDSLYTGDNVVWEIEAGTNIELFLESFIRQSLDDNHCMIYISFNRSPQSIAKDITKNLAHFNKDLFFLFDCFTSGKGKNDNKFLKFYETKHNLNIIKAENPKDTDSFVKQLDLIESNCPKNIRYIFDSLTGMQDLWGSEERAYKFFTYLCPKLYDMETVAYWVVEKDAHSQKFKANLRHITQLVLELYKRRDKLYIRAIKLDGRQNREAFKPHLYEIEDNNIKIILSKKNLITDIGSAIREFRIKRGISQKELADRVDLTASFISQLENNQIVPSLNSFLQICDALKISPSEILENKKLFSDHLIIRAKEIFSNKPDVSNGIEIYNIQQEETLSSKIILLPPETTFGGHFSVNTPEELIYIISGKLNITIKGKTEQLLEGDILYLKENLPSEWKNEGGEIAKLLSVSTIQGIRLTR
ncbi:MAG: helix-turn-helix domain-containing protein [Thermodesulfovibrionales bacterium]|nr:helix-turn-helix domain-containing protein [Thermodesulfovibrionales bacterium]